VIYAKLNSRGLLSDIRRQGPQQPGGVWPGGSQDVPLAAMPTRPMGTQYTYDAATQTAAVPLPATVQQAVCAGVVALAAGQSAPSWALAAIGAMCGQ